MGAFNHLSTKILSFNGLVTEHKAPKWNWNSHVKSEILKGNILKEMVE